MDNVQLTLKIPKDLRESFTVATKNQDTTNSQVLRKFIREYVAKNGQAKLL